VAATDRAFGVANLGDVPWGSPNDDGRVRVALREHFGIGSFGINAYRSLEGGPLIGEHSESGFAMGEGDQEELYLVVEGKATFNVDGERVEAPQGTLVYARPEAKRSATAEEPGTTVIAIGGTPGKAYVVLPEGFAAAYGAYDQKDYERSLELYSELLDSDFPRKAGILFNIACNEALLGRTDDAIAHVGAAIESDPRAVELAREDTDLDSLREDARFKELIA
jgi:tetratricopeptide (TPR) repeat protein